MIAEILRISQDIDLKTGASSYAAILHLPSGKDIRAIISEEDAQSLLKSLVGGIVQEQPEAMPLPESVPVRAQSSISANYPEEAVLFGGQEDLQGEPPPVLPPVQPQKPVRRMTTVPKDEYGYPVLPNRGIDPSELVGGGNNADEEGVGQG